MNLNPFATTRKKNVDRKSENNASATAPAPEKKAPARKGKKLIETSVSDGSRKASKWMADLRYGQTVSLNFFRQNAWILMIFLVVVIALMGLRYKTKTKMEEIKRLERELVQAESDKLQEKAAYMSLIRETEMKRLSDEKGLGLDFQEQPPYEVVLIDR